MTSLALSVLMVVLDGLHAVEVTIESVLCSYLEEDAMEEGVVHVHHATNSTLVMESGCYLTMMELMKMHHFQDT